MEDVRDILAECVVFGKTGEVDEDTLNIELGTQAFLKLKDSNENSSEVYLKLDFDSSEEQG